MLKSVCLSVFIIFKGSALALSITHSGSSFFPTQKPGSKQVTIVLHGLNNKPEVMNELIGVLNDQGKDCVRVALTGHNGDDDSKASQKAWLKDIESAITYAENLRPASRISFLGFSAGGTVIINYLDQHSEVEVDGIYLFAPALALKTYAQLVRLFIPLGFFGIPGFSVAPYEYRKYSFPSFKLYKSLFDTYNEVQTLKNPVRFKKTTLNILLAEGDELVSNSGIRRWLDKNQLAEFAKIETFEFEETVPDYKHQIIDPATLGTKNWERIREIIL